VETTSPTELRYTHPTLGIIGNEKYKSMPKIIIPNAIKMYLIS
jgi:hypothetical protein